jgi:hypothetical protein
MDEQPKTLRRRRFWIAPLIALTFLVAGAVWYFHGRTIWTDGHGNRFPSAESTLRQVIWTTPEPFDPAAFASDDQQYEPAISADGTEFYFVRGKPGQGAHIYASYRRDNQWTKPVRLDTINGPTDDLSPRLTADGKFLLFSSDRPGGVGGFDLWAASRTKDGWDKPFNLGSAVNTEFNESNPDPTPDGKRLIFSTDRKAAGKEQIQAWRATIRQTVSTDYDLWIASLDPTLTAAPTTQSAATTQATAVLVFKDAHEIPGINTSFVEGASCMSPAGDFLYFSSNRPGGFGKFDLYRSRITGNDFGPLENLGPSINGPGNETDPAITFAGFRLIFSSDRNSPRGVYALHLSDSHEVFPQLDPRPFPHFGWSIWSLIISALLLIPLIMAMRTAEGRRRLNTIQKCLILSLLVHAGLTFLFSFVLVTQEVARYVRKEKAEIAVNLNVPKDVEIGLAVRSQLSTDLPSTEIPPPAAQRAAVADETKVPTPTMKIDAPAHAAEKSAVASVAINSPPPLLSDSAPPPSPKPMIDIKSAASMLDAIAPKSTPEKVADRNSDVTPELKSPTVSQTRSRNSVDTSMPSPTISAELPKPAPGESTDSAAALPSSLQTANARSTAPPISDTAMPSAAIISTDHDPKLNGLSPIAPLGPTRIDQPAPTASAPAPGPSTSPLASSAAKSDETPSPAAVITTRNIPSKPTTAPSSFVDSGVLISDRRQADLPATSTAVAPSATAIAPIDVAAPALPPIAAALPRIQSDSTAATSVAVNEMLPTVRRTDTASTASAHLPADISSTAPITAPPVAVAPITAPTSAPGAGPLASPGISVEPQIAFAPVTGIDPGPMVKPSSPFPRSAEERQPRVKKLGGTRESEDAVDKGLAYLAANQERDGRWSFIASEDASPPGRRPQNAHDMANTGLTILALITRDHTPDKPGPYRNAVNKGLNYLIASQEPTGDLRGPAHLRGEGSRHGDMYDHAIATLALAEAALMTKDQRYVDAANLGARFIVAAQDPRSGGWRYIPGEAGDSSVLGWQIMALHSCEQLGFEVPPDTYAMARRYIRSASQGPRQMIASYQPRKAPLPSMTAELLYARMLLGQKLEEADITEATDFLAQQPPDLRAPSLYYWYYASLCMMQVQNNQWAKWNARTRDALIALQTQGGTFDGSWNADAKYADRGGRIYMTSIAVLTLEVYYRYQPIWDRK